MKNYVLMASGSWGAAQTDAVRNAHGTVTFSHAASGIGAATSGDPGFLKKLFKSGLFAGGDEDMQMQWVDPAHEQPVSDDLTEAAVTPGDETFINLQWNMTAIEASGAWNAGYDGGGVRVAVIDGGICKDHIDLKDNIDVAASRSFVPGFNFYDDTPGFMHACHVAGIIAAEDNGIGTIGVAPKATIISLKALHGGSGTFEAVIEAILYASDPISAGGAGADIINMSLGALFPLGGGNTGAGQLLSATTRAVNYATSHNVLVVCSAGNAAFDLDHTGSYVAVPAQAGSALAISATGPIGYAVGWPNGATNYRNPASYTNYGRSAIWVAAPGGNDQYVPTTQICAIPRVPSGSVAAPCWVFDLVISPGAGTTSYFFAEGTSMAAPHVSGVAALIRQAFPGILVGDLKSRLSQTADDEGAIGIDPYYGHGFVNARRAVTDPAPSALPFTLAQSPIGPHVDLLVAQDRRHSSTSFSFRLPAAGQARLELFDVAGRNVAVLYDGLAAAGRTAVSWNGQGSSGQQLKHGAYFARLSMGALKTTQKLVLVGN